MRLLGALGVLALAGPACANPLYNRGKRDDTTAPAATDTNPPATTGGTTSVTVSSVAPPEPTDSSSSVTGPAAIGEDGIAMVDIANYGLPTHFQAVLVAVATWDFDWLKDSVTEIDAHTVKYKMRRPGATADEEVTVALGDLTGDEYSWPAISEATLPWWPVGYLKAAMESGYDLTDESSPPIIKSADALATVARDVTEMGEIHLESGSPEIITKDATWDILKHGGDSPMVISLFDDEGDSTLFPPFQWAVKSVSDTDGNREVTYTAQYKEDPSEEVTNFDDLFDNLCQIFYLKSARVDT